MLLYIYFVERNNKSPHYDTNLWMIVAAKSRRTIPSVIGEGWRQLPYFKTEKVYGDEELDAWKDVKQLKIQYFGKGFFKNPCIVCTHFNAG